MSPPSIFICIRGALDWQDEAVVTKYLRLAFRPKLEAWSATGFYTSPYEDLELKKP